MSSAALLCWYWSYLSPPLGRASSLSKHRCYAVTCDITINAITTEIVAVAFYLDLASA